MPTTAYSQLFGREVDVRQFLALARITNGVNETAFELTAEQKEFARKDVLCACCGVGDAVIVRESRRIETGEVIGQAHFRFSLPVGEQGDAHRPGCEFREDDQGPPALVGGLIAFGEAKTRETKIIRELVCKGVEQGIFTQAHIRAMRQWYFDLNTGGQQFVMRATSDQVHLAWALRDFGMRNLPLAFAPIHATLPAFKWPIAAKRQLAFDLQSKIQAIGMFHGAPLRDAVKRLAKSHYGHLLPDVVALQDAYRQTMQFASLANDYGDLRLSKSRALPDSLLAFAALLLHMAKNDMTEAVGFLSRILNSPEPKDPTLGNVMGLNPFRDYYALGHAKRISDLAAAGGLDVDLTDAIDKTEAHIRAMYLASGLPGGEG